MMFRSRAKSTPLVEDVESSGRKRASRQLSFTSIANAIVPNFFSDEEIVITSIRTATVWRDMLYMHQIVSINPYNLDRRSFQVAGVVDSDTVSGKVFKSLQKAEILSSDGAVDTRKIGKNFIHQVSIINSYRQKELINMLFWWEEECQRLRKLICEDEELTAAIEESEKSVSDSDHYHDVDSVREMVDQLKFARERVRMKIRQRPSERRPDVEADTDNTVAEAFSLINRDDRDVPAGSSAILNTAQQSRSLSNATMTGNPPPYRA